MDLGQGQPLIGKSLRLAIADKRLLQIVYKRKTRVVEPHDYGVYRGIERLLAYQRRVAPAEPGRATGWRLFDIPKIEAVLVLEETFPGSRGDSHRHHLEWDDLYARVAP